MKFTRIFSTLGVLACTLNLSAQDFDVAWQLESNTPGYGVSILEPSPDGNAIFAMTIYSELSFEGYDFEIPEGNSLNYVVGKLDPNGDIIWMRDLGIPSFTGSIAVDSEGNFYAMCPIFDPIEEFELDGQNFTVPPGIIRSFLFKFDSDGNLIWGHNLNDPANFLNFNGAGRVEVDSEDNFVINGQFKGSVILDGPLQSSAGGFNAVYVAKGDPDGNFLWQKKLEVDIDQIGAAAVEINEDDEIFMTGAWDGNEMTIDDITLTNSDDGMFSFDSFVLKLSPEGEVVWLSQQTGPAGSGDQVIALSEEGGVTAFQIVDAELTVGEHTVDETGLYAIKYNFEGAAEEPVYLGEGFVSDFKSCPDGGYIGMYSFQAETVQTGSYTFTNYGGANGTRDIVVFKLDADLNVEYAFQIGGNEEDGDITEGAVSMLDSGQLLMGFWAGSSEISVLDQTISNELSPLNKNYLIGLDLSSSLITHTVNTVQVFPNPANDFIAFNSSEYLSGMVQIDIIDMQGRLVAQENMTLAISNRLYVSDLENGIYFLNYELNGQRFAGKFVVNR